MTSVDVGALTDFPVGRAVVVVADGREVGVVRWADTVYAVRNVCPHQSAPLCHGRVERRISAEASVGSIELDAGAPVMSCPWHGWEFDLATGRSVSDAECRVRVYEVEVREGRVLVTMGAHHA